MAEKKKRKYTKKSIIDKIQNIVDREFLTPAGFTMYDRNHNRTVDTDLVQVIYFHGSEFYDIARCSWYLNVEIGLFVPEYYEANMWDRMQTDYADIAECDVRTNFKSMIPAFELYELDVPFERLDQQVRCIADSIIGHLKTYAMPFFDDLNNRDKLLENEQKYGKILINTKALPVRHVMIYLKRGEIQKAEALLNEHYDKSVEGFKKEKLKDGDSGYYIPMPGHIFWLHKFGERFDLEIQKPYLSPRDFFVKENRNEFYFEDTKKILTNLKPYVYRRNIKNYPLYSEQRADLITAEKGLGFEYRKNVGFDVYEHRIEIHGFMGIRVFDGENRVQEATAFLKRVFGEALIRQRVWSGEELFSEKCVFADEMDQLDFKKSPNPGFFSKKRVETQTVKYNKVTGEFEEQ